MKSIFLILLFLIISCQSKVDESIFSNKKYGIENKIYGDSLKVIYNYKGDTIIQNRIDLKVEEDDFDNSFEVTSIWSTKLTSDFICFNSLKINYDNIQYKFCLSDAIEKIDKDIIKYRGIIHLSFGLDDLKRDLENYKNGSLKKYNEEATFYLVLNLLRGIKFSAYDEETNTKVNRIRIEKVITSFSGNRYYYYINKYNDTIAHYRVNEWMK